MDKCFYYIITAIILIIMGFISFILIYKNQTENFINIPQKNGVVKWAKNKKCNYHVTKTLLDVFNEYDFQETKNDDWDIYIPCTYNKITEEISVINPKNNEQRIFIINNADELASKNGLWKNLVNKYGREEAKKLMPVSYLIYNPYDLWLFNQEYSPNKIYILKKNIQRQQGLKITKNKNYILTASKDGYVVVQELLQDPYIINGKKINLRIYVLVVCQNNEISAYVHREGFMYYTKIPYVKNSIKDDPNITTGYIDRKVYEENPLTHGDFRKFLDSKRIMTSAEEEVSQHGQKLSEIVFERIYVLLGKVIASLTSTVCVGSHIKNNITFQLFGFDVAINDNLIPQVIECNKGPDLGAKDPRDSEIKRTVVRDILKTIKVIPEDNNGFIKIY